MDRYFAEALKLVLKHEVNFSGHPADPGGATMKSITLATFHRYVDPKATKDDLRNIMQAQLQDVYRRHYWNAARADDLPDGVDYATFDFAVNSGPSRATKYLQAAIGVRQMERSALRRWRRSRRAWRRPSSMTCAIGGWRSCVG